jgi:hypothetical protein
MTRVEFLVSEVRRLKAALRQVEHRTASTTVVHMIARRAWRHHAIISNHMRKDRIHATKAG